MGDSYSMKIPQEMADFIEKYLAEHKELGLKFVSQYVLKILREHIENLLNLGPEPREKVITLRTGTYTREQLKELLEDMKE